MMQFEPLSTLFDENFNGIPTNILILDKSWNWMAVIQL